MTITALRALLADIDRQGGPDAARAGRLTLPPPARSISFTAVRTWARQNGVACQPHGRPPQAAIDAWRAAHNLTDPTEGEAP